MAEALVKYETIDDGQIKDIMAGRPPRTPTDWDDTLSSKGGGGAARPTPSSPGGGLSPAGEGSAS
jgi:cell division protease FtsH